MLESMCWSVAKPKKYKNNMVTPVGKSVSDKDKVNERYLGSSFYSLSISPLSIFS